MEFDVFLMHFWNLNRFLYHFLHLFRYLLLLLLYTLLNIYSLTSNLFYFMIFNKDDNYYCLQ